MPSKKNLHAWGGLAGGEAPACIEGPCDEREASRAVLALSAWLVSFSAPAPASSFKSWEAKLDIFIWRGLQSSAVVCDVEKAEFWFC